MSTEHIDLTLSRNLRRFLRVKLEPPGEGGRLRISTRIWHCRAPGQPPLATLKGFTLSVEGTRQVAKAMLEMAEVAERLQATGAIE